MKIKRWLLLGATGVLLVAPMTLLAEGPPSPEEIEAEHSAVFAQADADGSGTLSVDEFKTFESLIRERMTQRHFARADADGDGVLSLDEVQAARPGPGHGPGRWWHH